jgi:hypothetical protein
VTHTVDEIRWRAVHTAEHPADEVFPYARLVDVIVQLRGEAFEIECQFFRITKKAFIIELWLVLEQCVVHLPEEEPLKRFDDRMRRTAERALIVAVLEQGDRSVSRPLNVIARAHVHHQSALSSASHAAFLALLTLKLFKRIENAVRAGIHPDRRGVAPLVGCRLAARNCGSVARVCHFVARH